MARTTFIDIPEGQAELYYNGLQAGDRFEYPRITRKTAFFSRKKKAKLKAKGYLTTIKNIWSTFSNAEKQAWKDVDPHTRQHGWRTFVADQSKRILNGLEGTATPNALHQDMIGAIDIEAPAEEVKIAQFHPATYYVQQKVQGKKSQYNPVEVTEQVALPISISLNYTSDLISTGAGSFVKFTAEVVHYYQGVNRTTVIDISMSLISDWVAVSESLSVVVGEVVGYTLYLHLYKVQGTFRFDNPKVEHSGQNWMRDPYCKDISKSFTRAFYQVPQNWGAITLPSGSAYGSVYPF
jgi:hypothetical protein